jgi:hypothetical protein
MAGEQDRSRTDPFAGQPPNTARDYGRAPSDLSTAPPVDRVRPLDGQQARYRLAFVAMEVPGLPAVVKIGPVEITQQAGPIWTQHTYIRQRPGWRPRYDKTMHQGYLQVGEGLQLTLAELPVVVPRSQHIQGALARWRDQVLAAISMLAALLDERVAQRELLEDLIVYDSTGSRPWASVDTGVRVRDFLPRNRVLLEQRELLEQLASFDLSQERAELGAGRGIYELCSQVRRRMLSCSSGSRWRPLPRRWARETPGAMCAVLRMHSPRPGWRWTSLSCLLAVLLGSEPTSCTGGWSNRSCCTRVSTCLRPSLGSSFDTGLG